MRSEYLITDNSALQVRMGLTKALMKAYPESARAYNLRHLYNIPRWSGMEVNCFRVNFLRLSK